MKRCYVFLENCIIYGQVRKKQTVDYRQDNLRSANDLNMNLYFVYHRSVSLGKFFDQIFTFSVTDRNLDVVDAEYIIILNGFDVNRINEKSLMSADVSGYSGSYRTWTDAPSSVVTEVSHEHDFIMDSDRNEYWI